MGRKPVEMTAEEQDKYSGCKLCGIEFSKFNTLNGEQIPYPLAKLRGQYEKHITSKHHQALAKGVETVAPEHNSSLELKVKQLEDKIDALENRYTTVSQLCVRYSNDTEVLTRAYNKLSNFTKLLMRDLRADTARGMECLGEFKPDDAYRYKSFDTRLRELEQSYRAPIPDGERVIPTPITVNNHREVQLIDTDYVPELIKPKTMILTEDETPPPTMIPETLKLDVLKGVKKVQLVEERSEVRHIIPTKCEEDEVEDDDYYRRQVKFNIENPQWSDSNDSEESREEVKYLTPEEEREQHWNDDKAEIYGEAWELINREWETIIVEKTDDNKDKLDEIVWELEELQRWITMKLEETDYIKERPLKSKQGKKEALRVYNHIGSVVKLIQEIIDKYETVEWNKQIREIGQELETIADATLTVENIMSGEMFIY